MLAAALFPRRRQVVITGADKNQWGRAGKSIIMIVEGETCDKNLAAVDSYYCVYRLYTATFT